MIKLRCLFTCPDYGKFEPGKVYNATKFYINDEMTKGAVTIKGGDNKETEQFEFKDKNLVTKTEAFRLVLVPKVDV